MGPRWMLIVSRKLHSFWFLLQQTSVTRRKRRFRLSSRFCAGCREFWLAARAGYMCWVYWHWTEHWCRTCSLVIWQNFNHNLMHAVLQVNLLRVLKWYFYRPSTFVTANHVRALKHWHYFCVSVCLFLVLHCHFSALVANKALLSSVIFHYVNPSLWLSSKTPTVCTEPEWSLARPSFNPRLAE